MVTGGGFFSWGTKFKYTGRTEKEILVDSENLSREEPSIQRSASLRRKASSVPATPSTPLQPHIGKNKRFTPIIIIIKPSYSFFYHSSFYMIFTNKLRCHSRIGPGPATLFVVY